MSVGLTKLQIRLGVCGLVKLVVRLGVFGLTKHQSRLGGIGFGFTSLQIRQPPSIGVNLEFWSYIIHINNISETQ